eukprot:4475536-Pyramimonas_sp.AAC.1
MKVQMAVTSTDNYRSHDATRLVFLTLCGCGPVPQFAIPDLRVGTLDSLLTLSDDLVKSSTVAEQTLAK